MAEAKTLQETMWDELVSIIDELMEPSSRDLTIDDPSLARLKGRADGIAWCLAVLRQSPNPLKLDKIKTEAMERWEQRSA